MMSYQGPTTGPNRFNLEVGKTYEYSLPSFTTPDLVTVEAGEGDSAGKLFIRFDPNLIPERLENIPANATFREVTSD